MKQTLEKAVDWLPQAVAALVLLLAAWFVAMLVRYVVRKALQRTRVDQRWGDGNEETSMARTLSEGAYWIVFLLFVPLILDVLGLHSLFDPFAEMAIGFLAFVPNLVGAGLILIVGWFVARFVRRITTALLASAGVDRFAHRLGGGPRARQFQLSRLIGLVAYVLVLIPVAVAALNALNLEAVTAPASAMLTDVLAALPALFGAAVVLAVAYAIGIVVRGVVTHALHAMRFDRLFEQMGVWTPTEPLEYDESAYDELFGPPEDAVPAPIAATPSSFVGSLAFVGVILVGAMAALRLMQFTVLEAMLADFIVFASQILLGLGIFAVGMLLASGAARLVRSSDTRNSRILAQLARAAILVLAGAMALRQMGLANEIITLAFAFLVGAIAVAAGIAFGVGGREVAADILSDWRRKMSEGERRRPTAAE